MEMDLPPRDKALMLIGKDAEFNDISLHCSCPSFKFHYQYVASQKGASIEPESRPPVKTNPDRKGIVCKHARRINSVAPFYWPHLAAYIRDNKGEYRGDIFVHNF